MIKREVRCKTGAIPVAVIPVRALSHQCLRKSKTTVLTLREHGKVFGDRESQKTCQVHFHCQLSEEERGGPGYLLLRAATFYPFLPVYSFLFAALKLPSGK
jgi:hypothetical protein